MRSKMSSFLWSRCGPYIVGSALAPLLAVYLFVGTCGGGKSGLVLAFRGWGVAVTAAWCEAPAPNRS